MDAFLFYIDDWLSSGSIAAMDAAEERGYLRLLLRAAKEPDCRLPDDDAQLAVISLLGKQWWRPTKDPDRRFGAKTSGEKIRECFEAVDGRLHNERLHREWRHQKEVREKRREFGKLGGRPSTGNQKVISEKPKGYSDENQKVIQMETKMEPKGKANGNQTETNPNPNPSNNTPSSPPCKKRMGDVSPCWFAEFWALYPRRVGKGAAKQAARKCGDSAEVGAKIIAALKRQLPMLSASEINYIPHPSTWLRQERYDDEAQVSQPIGQLENRGTANLPIPTPPKGWSLE
jgi:uncharacterized protein YdaU (DUF1376 family)